MSETKIEKNILGLSKALEEASGAITCHIENLKSPLNDLILAFNTYSQETKELTKGLVFWTKVMAIAIIIQILVILITAIFG